MKLKFCIVFLIMGYGLAQACPSSTLLEFTLENETGHTLQIHSDQSCSCSSGVNPNDQILENGRSLTFDNTSDSNCTASAEVWYHVLDLDTLNQKEILKASYEQKLFHEPTFTYSNENTSTYSYTPEQNTDSVPWTYKMTIGVPPTQ
jgi:hypothetical protein